MAQEITEENYQAVTDQIIKDPEQFSAEEVTAARDLVDVALTKETPREHRVSGTHDSYVDLLRTKKKQLSALLAQKQAGTDVPES